jgi:tripartite-type tricarboxylate transporter receptor subunit TctC
MAFLTTRRAAALAAAAACLCTQAALAQTYPDKPVTVIVPFSAGGSLDAIARAVAQKMSEQTGKTFIVDNKPGFSGNLGAQQVAKSRPDGYTLLFTSLTTASITSFMYTNGIGYKLGQELVPVALAATLPVVLIASPASGIGNYAELIAAAKSKPAGITFGSAGAGSIEHVAAELFKREAKVANLTHVPYKGGADALRDLMGNQIDIVFGTGGGMFTAMDAGKVKGVAVAASKRAPIVPNLPTLQEAGLAGFDAAVVYGFLAPAGLPAGVTSYLEGAISKALQQPDTARKLADQSGEVRYENHEQAAKTLQQQMDKWGKVVREANIKAD